MDHFILHTGQHYSYNMDKVFFEQLGLPEAKYNLDAGMHGEQTGKMLAGIEKVLIEEKPDVVLVQGDTNTVLAGALAASKLHIKDFEEFFSRIDEVGGTSMLFDEEFEE